MFSSSPLIFGSQGASVPVTEARQKKEDSESCLPVTLRILQDAVARRADNGEVQIHGTEPAMLLLVGSVETLSRSMHSLEFTINDGTGRMQARYYTSGKELADVQPGRHVSIVGCVRSAPSVHLAVTCMRLIDSPDEISYHLIEVAHAALKLKKGPKEPATPSPIKHAPAAEITPEKMENLSPTIGDVPMTPLPTFDLMQAAPVAAEKPKGKLEGPALQTAVMDFLRQEGEGKEEGVQLAAIIKHLASNAEEEVRELMQKLVDEAEIFHTIDEQHFQIL